MSAPTYADFAARFPELATSAASEQSWIGATLTREWARTDQTFWATERGEATLLRSAHRWALAKVVMQGGAGTVPTGALTSESADAWSRSYSAPSNSRSSTDQQDYGRTAYGLEYLTLRDSRPMAYARVSR